MDSAPLVPSRRRDEMNPDPREVLSLTVKSRSQALTWLRGAFRCFARPPWTISHPAVPRLSRRALDRATPRLWPHAKPLLTGTWRRRDAAAGWRVGGVACRRSGWRRVAA